MKIFAGKLAYMSPLLAVGPFMFRVSGAIAAVQDAVVIPYAQKAGWIKHEEVEAATCHF